MNSIDTHFSRNVFEAVPKTCSTGFIASKTTWLRLVVLNLIKHCCLFFKYYINANLMLAIKAIPNLSNTDPSQCLFERGPKIY